jgi:hypothetical protein
MISAAIGMFLALSLLLTHLSAQTKRRLVGYALFVDIGAFALCLTLFGGTGNERLGAIGAAIGITASLHLYKWLFGYERLTKDGWVRYAGVLT